MLARKHLKSIRNYQPGKPIEEVKRELGLREVVKLASNESAFAPSRKVRDILFRNIEKVNRYPDAQGYYLKRALTKIFRVDNKNLILGNGSDELIVLAQRAFVEPGEEIIVGYPTFLIYEIQAKASAIKVSRSPLKNFRYDLEDIKNKITGKTKLIFIANPDNPNGTYLTHKQIRDFLRSIPRKIIVFFDEAYFEFAPKDFPRSVDFLKQGYNIIFSRTFSKAYSLAGLRVGYAVSKTEFIQVMDKVREPFNVNLLAQLAARAALEDKKYVSKVVACVNREKDYLYGKLDELGLDYIRSATNFILINLMKISSKYVFNELLKRGVIIREMSPWGFKNFIRVTAGRHAENVKFVKALGEIVGSR